jgi:FixJ family two-component response regulator
MIAERRAPFARGCQPESFLQTPTVHVIDPDAATGEFVKELVEGHDIEVQSHRTARAFFSTFEENCPGCIVLETRILDASGFQIRRRLVEQNQHLPMVFVTSSIDVSTAVSLLRDGAVHVLEKPLRGVELQDAIHEALAFDDRQRNQAFEELRVRESIAMLTSKERCFIGLLAGAKSIKAIASQLSISSRAVELRRRSVMDKLGFETSVDLLRFALVAHGRFGDMLTAPATAQLSEA